MTALLITLICVQFVLAFAPHFMKETFQSLPDEIYSSYYLFILLYSFISVAVWILHAFTTYKQTNLRTLFHFKNNYSGFSENCLKKRFANKPHNSILERKRNNLRKINVSAALVLCMLSLIPSIIFQSFPLFVGLALIWILSILIIDRLVSNYRYRTFYDSLTAKNKPNPYRGLAKIYRWEYEKTGFDFKDKYYRNPIPIHSNECYKNIFFMAYDRNKWSLLNLYLLVIYIYFYFLAIAALSRFIGNKSLYFRLPDDVDVNLLIMIYLVTVGVFCIITALCNKNYFTALSFATYSLAHINEHPEDAGKLYLTMQSENILRNVDNARGIYVYNISRFEKGDFAEDISPESDRMLYYHQALTYKAAHRITFWFIYGILFFLGVWHTGRFILFIPLTITVLPVYFLTTRFAIDRIHYRKIVREIKKLNAVSKK